MKIDIKPVEGTDTWIIEFPDKVIFLITRTEHSDYRLAQLALDDAVQELTITDTFEQALIYIQEHTGFRYSW